MIDHFAPENTDAATPMLGLGDLRSPFPYFGGKSRAARLVWERFGTPVNFVEPFAGSLAVLLACPDEQRPRVETVNDAAALLPNFWRAVRFDPEAVARWADWPVHEIEMHVHHRWLLKMIPLVRARLEADPMWFDARVAGYWVHGASAWIGSGWCEEGQGTNHKRPDLAARSPADVARPSMGSGIHAAGMREPSRQLPDFGGSTDTGGPTPAFGRGVHASGTRAPSVRLPDLAGGTQWGTDEPNSRAGKGIHGATMRGPSRQLPDVAARTSGGFLGQGVHGTTARTRLYDIFAALSARLRYVRVACGDAFRILTPSVTFRHGLTAVFLDPPYDGYEHVYGVEKSGEPLSARVRAWALEMGARPDMRIALCGYEGEHTELETAGWEVVSWKSKGGYSNQREGGDNGNKHRERIWFSPACERPSDRRAPVLEDLGPLFAARST